MRKERFATAINCIDGRAQIPVMDWLKLHCNVHYVDLITEPGPDKTLPYGAAEVVAAIKGKVKLSLHAHESSVVALVGHHGCVANPLSKEEHWAQITEGVRVLITWELMVRIVGLWVNEWHAVGVVCGTQEREAARSYL